MDIEKQGLCSYPRNQYPLILLCFFTLCDFYPQINPQIKHEFNFLLLESCNVFFIINIYLIPPNINSNYYSASGKLF